MTTKDIHENHETAPPLGLGSSEGLGAWLPIATAPRDGTKIIVNCPWLGVCGPAIWDDDKYAKKPRPHWTHWGARIWGVLRVREDQPTHWMPMPAPPKALNVGAKLETTAPKQ